MTAVPQSLAAALADHYRLEREVGAGGMATVYLAEDLKHHRRVAVKVLRPELAATLGGGRFLREVGFAARLNHPHILPLHDSGEAAGFLYYVMPYVEGISLRQKLIREGELPIAEAVRILRDVADAMADAHAHGIVHRDIKPENVMLTGRHAVVMDFGVAKALGDAQGPDAASYTSAGLALGTPAYMAPEQAAGFGQVDARADLYAWGVLAYELLAGQVPFVRSTPQATLTAHLAVTPEPISAQRATVPAALAALVMQCLEKRAADRPQSATEVMSRLEAVLTPSEGMTPPGPQPHRPAAPRREVRLRRLRGIAAAAAVGALALLAWRLWPRTVFNWRSAQRTPIAVRPFEVRGGGASFAELGRDFATQAILGLQQAALGPLAGADEVAAIHVTGSITIAGDSLEVVARLERTGDGQTVWVLGPERGLAGAPAPVLARMQDRVLGAVGYYLAPPNAYYDGAAFPPPPSLQAFHLLQRAEKLATPGKWADAYVAYEEAYRSDTTWLLPLLRLELAYINSAKPTLADSVLAVLVARRERLSPGMRRNLDGLLALRGSPEEEYAAALAEWRADSSDWRSAASMLVAMARTRHAGEAIRFFREHASARAADPDSVTWLRAAADAHHLLGQFDEELALARRARAASPTALATWRSEAIALGALGRMAAIDSLVTASATLENPNAPGIMMREAANELTAHGFREAAAPLWDRYLTEYVPRQPPVNQRLLASLAYAAMGRFDEARRIRLTDADPGPDGFGVRARALAYAVAGGDTVGAGAMLDSLQRFGVTVPAQTQDITPRVRAMVTRAELLSLLGRKAEAVAMLRTALNSGYRVPWDIEHQWQWAPLRDYPPFQALVRPRD